MGEILQLAQQNPARIVGDFIASPKVGSIANLVYWQTREGALQVKETIIGPWVISSAV
jgi:cytosine/adenosine deaminase-related metal-dependent hydrolase